jgi:hypothetical protein
MQTIKVGEDKILGGSGMGPTLKMLARLSSQEGAWTLESDKLVTFIGVMETSHFSN